MLCNFSKASRKLIPFDLKRAGLAQIAPTPKSAPIGKELEGRWSGTIDVGGKTERLVLKMTNHADGTSTGRAYAVPT